MTAAPSQAARDHGPSAPRGRGSWAHNLPEGAPRPRRAVVTLLLALAVVASACASGGRDDADEVVEAATPVQDPAPDIAVGGDASSDPVTVDATPADESSPPEWPWELAAAGVDVPASVPLEDIRPGGPPPDGIPPIDEPTFESVADAGEWLTAEDPVQIVRAGGVTRAYPLAIMTFHEIVNDVVGGQPLVVTYCPLCNSALVFSRVVDAEVLPRRTEGPAGGQPGRSEGPGRLGEIQSFGTSGRLWHSNLVMYDRATRSLWSQFTGEAIVGELLGTTLERLPTQIVSFGQLAEASPDAEVLSRDTGHSRPYGQNPYTGYDTASSPFLFDGETGGPLPQMARVVTVGEEDAIAVPLDVLVEQRVVHATADGRDVVVLWTPGTASALDTDAISEGRDVGATGVFSAEVDGRPTTFRAEGDEGFVDEATGSEWTILGDAVAGPLSGTRLEQLPHDDTFWFVQYAFRPDTEVVDG